MEIGRSRISQRERCFCDDRRRKGRKYHITESKYDCGIRRHLKVDLTSLMMKNFIPAICAVVVIILLSTMLSKKQGVQVSQKRNLPSPEFRLVITELNFIDLGFTPRMSLANWTDKRISEELRGIKVVGVSSRNRTIAG